MPASPRAVAAMAVLTALLPLPLLVAAQSAFAGVVMTSNSGAAVLAIDGPALPAGSALTIITHQEPQQVGTTSSIAGIAREASGGVLPGVTIDIVGAGRRQKVTTSVSGRYALNNLVPGLYQVTATLAGFEAAFCDVTVERGAEAVCNVTMRVGMTDPELTRRGGFSTSPIEIGRFIREALEARLAAGGIADGALLGRSGRVVIREEMPRAKGLVPADAIPRRAGETFELTPLAALQAEADRSGQPIYFLFVDSPTIAGDVGTLIIGVDVVFPSQSKVVKMCCCQALDRFRLVTGRWIFDRRVSGSCS